MEGELREPCFAARQTAARYLGEVAGGALAAGETPAPEFAAGETAGEEAGEGCLAAGEGEVCGAACCFISSRRKALLAVLLCA